MSRRLRTLIETKMTMQSAAALTNVSPAHLSRVSNGERKASDRLVAALAELLEVTEAVVRDACEPDIDLAALPVLVNVETAARIMGMPESTLYAAIKRDGCNLPLVRLGPHRTMVASRPLLAMLGLAPVEPRGMGAGGGANGVAAEGPEEDGAAESERRSDHETAP